MNTKELIKTLKKMPQNLDVGVSMHDNSEHEVAGWVSGVSIDNDNGFDTHGNINKIQGKKCIILHC